jgi:hypothetical protein
MACLNQLAAVLIVNLAITPNYSLEKDLNSANLFPTDRRSVE